MDGVSTQGMVAPPPEKMLTGDGNLKPNSLEGKLFIEVEKIPWTPFSIPGNYFKILMIDNERITMFMKQDADAVLNPHKHDTPVELFLLEGSVGYKDPNSDKEYRIGKMGYMFEPPGTVHAPVTSGAMGLAILHGPITGFNDKNEPVSVTAQDLYNMAKANNAVSHFEPRNTDWYGK